MGNVLSIVPERYPDVRSNLATIYADDTSDPVVDRIAIAYACAFLLRNKTLTSALETDFLEKEGQGPMIEAAKTAAVLMAQNNVYYSAVGLASDSDLSRLPARLRMSGLGNPPIDKITFEKMNLAVSAIGKCQGCIRGHIRALRDHGCSIESIQLTLKIAAIIFSVHVAMQN